MKKFIITILSLFAFAAAGDIVPNGIGQGDLYTLLKNLVDSRMYMNCSDMGVTANNAASANFAVTATGNFINNGYMYTQTPSTDVKAYTKSAYSSITRTYSTFPVSYYVLNVNSSNSFYVSSSLGDYLPPKVAGYTPIGGVRVSLSSDNTNGFTLGTTTWNATSQNYSFFDVSAFPTGQGKVSLTGL